MKRSVWPVLETRDLLLLRGRYRTGLTGLPPPGGVGRIALGGLTRLKVLDLKGNKITDAYIVDLHRLDS